MIWAIDTCSDFYSCYVNSRMSVSIHIDIIDSLTRSLESLKFGHKISKVEEWKHHLNQKRCIKVRFSLVPELIIESFESKYVLCVLCSKPLLIRLILCGHLWNELQLQILTFSFEFQAEWFYKRICRISLLESRIKTGWSNKRPDFQPLRLLLFTS